MENCREIKMEPTLGKKRKRKKKRKGLPEDELQLLNDLSSFPHLASMFQAHVRKTTAKKKKMRKKRKKMCDNELKLLTDLSGFPHLAMMLQAQKILRAKRVVTARECLKNNKGNFAENGTWSRSSADVSRENEEVKDELLLTCKDDDTLDFMDLPSASPDQDYLVSCSNFQTIRELTFPSGDLAGEQPEKNRTNECDESDYAMLSLAEDILPMKLLVHAGNKGPRKELSTSIPIESKSVVTEENIVLQRLPVDAGNKDPSKELSMSVPIESKSAVTGENIVLQRLLRRSRYFDMGDENFHSPTAKDPRQPCYICGDLQHTGNKCRKRRVCYFCNGGGHLAVDCPKRSQEFNFCLRCMESGHELFSCNNDYPPEDLKNIVCYVCNEGGHICCYNYSSTHPHTASCYNCGEFGHSCMQCPKPLMNKSSSQPPSICSKCGEKGHAARKCGVAVQNKDQ